MRRKWHAGAAISAALVSAMVVAAGCSSLLGLGDFKDQKADASAGNGGSTAGGAGGAGGTTSQAGAGGTDGGGYSCKLDGAPFTIMTPTQTGGVTGKHSTYVTGNPIQNQVFVVMGGQKGETVLIQRVTDSPGNRLGQLVTYSLQQGEGGSGSLYVTGAELRNGALHVTGHGYIAGTTQGDEGIDLVFSLNGQDLNPTPVVNPIPVPCDSGAEVRSALYRWDASGTRHSAVTCVEPGDGGIINPASTWDLFVDGQKLDSKTPGDNNVEVTQFVLSGKQYYLLSGEAPTEGGIYHAALGSTGSVSRVPLRLSSKTDQASKTFLIWPVTTGISVLGIQVGLQLTDAGPQFMPPAAFWQGVFTDAQLGDLKKVPPPEMKVVQSLQSVSDFVQYSEPRFGAFGAVMAGASMVGDTAKFSIYSPAGVPLVIAKQAAQADASKGDQILDASAGVLGMNPIVVWNVQNTTSSDSTLMGQVYSCY